MSSASQDDALRSRHNEARSLRDEIRCLRNQIQPLRVERNRLISRLQAWATAFTEDALELDSLAISVKSLEDEYDSQKKQIETLELKIETLELQLYKANEKPQMSDSSASEIRIEVCIFAYGQTGSGKTYTMMGRLEDPEQQGLIPRSLEQIFRTSQSLQTQALSSSFDFDFAPLAMDALSISKRTQEVSDRTKSLVASADIPKIVIIASSGSGMKASRYDAVKQNESLLNEVGCLHNELEQLKVERDPLISTLKAWAKVGIEDAHELDSLAISIELMEDKCDFQKKKIETLELKIETLELQLSKANQKPQVCIFAYGQTGSGKMYTMMGRLEDPEQQGLIPRSLEQIFSTSQSLQTQGWKCEMRASMLEIYNDTIRDLLPANRSSCSDQARSESAVKGKKYSITHDEKGNKIVSDLTIVDVSSIAEISALLLQAAQCWSVWKTQMNEQPSRSHMGTGQGNHGVLNLIDLAGSERLSKSGATGERLKEAQAINKSLSALVDVISAVAKKDAHVPFRNSKLTHLLLQPCLSGASKTLMFVNISPDQESLASLKLASRVDACEMGVPCSAFKSTRKRKD